MYHGGIILKMVPTPSTAIITRTSVSISIVYAAVITYTSTPITVVEAIEAIIITPVTRSPQIAKVWRFYPYTRYPEIIAVFITICPIARLPKVSIDRTVRLVVIGQWRRGNSYSDGDTYSYSGINCGGLYTHSQCEKKNQGNTFKCSHSCGLFTEL
jgi:hypothetical protein